MIIFKNDLTCAIFVSFNPQINGIKSAKKKTGFEFFIEVGSRLILASQEL